MAFYGGIVDRAGSALSEAKHVAVGIRSAVALQSGRVLARDYSGKGWRRRHRKNKSKIGPDCTGKSLRLIAAAGGSKSIEVRNCELQKNPQLPSLGEVINRKHALMSKTYSVPLCRVSLSCNDAPRFLHASFQNLKPW